jgi:hypothetical protein
VSGTRPIDGTPEAPGRDAGRTDGLEVLRGRLSSAGPDYLDGAAENPLLGNGEMVLLLRNRAARPALLSGLARARRWTRYHEIKKALVAHPSCPLAASHALLPHLFWKDHLDLALDVRAHPVVRRRAEQLVLARLDELGTGELVAVATRATRALIARLAESRNPRVLERLISNARVVEADVLRIARSRHAPATVLARLTGHHRWCGRLDVRTALLRNPRTPVQASLGLLGRLEPESLRRVARDAKVPRIVRIGAERRLLRCNGNGSRAACRPA